MDFIKFASERFSVRNFENKHIESHIIEKILKAGHIAPTGCNNQPQRILVMNTDSSIEKLKNCTKCHFNAPTAMLVCYNQDESWIRPYDGAMSAPVDAVIVATHIMLAAHSFGIGSCWVMHFNPQKMADTFNIPNNIKPVALIVMGYPSQDAQPLKLHSQYRPINETVVYDNF